MSATQELGAVVLLAEAKCGKLFNALLKFSGGDRRSENFKILPATKFENEVDDNPVKQKLEVARDLGFSKDQVSQFQKLADNPAIVQKNIADAKDNGVIPTRISVLDEIKKVPKQEKANEHLERKHFEPADEMPADVCKLFQDYIRGGLPQIADNSNYQNSRHVYSKMEAHLSVWLVSLICLMSLTNSLNLLKC